MSHTVQIPFNNWFDEYIESTIEQISSIIGNDGNHIVITCCGMSAKVLIYELKKRFPNGIYLDFGSALDFLCTKKNSRGYGFNYDELKLVFQDILPDDWEDEKYNEIYAAADTKLGTHLKNIVYTGLNIAKHISFFLSDSTIDRVKYLNMIIREVNTYNYKTDLFIHVNNDYPLDNIQLIGNKNGFIKIVCHNMVNTHPHYLTWKCRELLKEQRNDYDIFIYIEDDILIRKKTIDYWVNYKNLVLKTNNNLGFIRVEVDNMGNEYCVDIFEKMNATVTINEIPFINNNKNPYCGFWIYDKLEFNRFVNSHYYDISRIEGYKIREKSAVGLHGLESVWYNDTVIPIIENKPIDACKIYHLANNYLSKKSILFDDIILIET